MAVPNLPFNPMLTTNASGSFSAQSVGYIQGQVIEDAAIRNELAAGVLAASETIPMWGGVAIKEFIPASGTLGGQIARADTAANIKGFSVYQQAGAMLKTPQSTAPVALSGGQVMFYRMGSGARIVVQIDPALAATLQNGTSLIDTQVTWDLTNQKIIAFNTNALAAKIIDIQIGNSKIVTYDAVNNLCTWTNTGATAVIVI